MRISEIFMSIEGEGPAAGMPTVFVRFFGCNLSCPGFGRDKVLGEKRVSFDAKFETGCDSAYSWHPDFKDQAKDYTAEEVVNKIHELMGKVDPQYRVTKRYSAVVSFTGGEPLLQASAINDIISGLCRYNPDIPFIIETNGTVPNKIADRYSGNVVFSVSPKLSNSGEPPHVAKAAADFIVQAAVSNVPTYVKFVSDGSDASFEEINKFSMGLQDRGVIHEVYVMPEQRFAGGPCPEVERIADFCIRHSYRYCARVHNTIYGNRRGT